MNLVGDTLVAMDAELAELNYPVDCPHCGTPTVVEDSFPKCPNYHCSGRVYGRVMKYVEVLDIKGVGEETVKGLVEKGWVTHPCHLYKISKEQFVQLDRKGEAHYGKFRYGLEARKELDLAEFLGALSISEAATGTWQHVVRLGLSSYQDIRNATPEKLAQAERVTVRKACLMLEELKLQGPMVELMLAEGLVVVRQQKMGTKLSGKTVAITGTLSRPRKFYEDAVKAAGGFFATSVTSKTDFLVMADPGSASSKAQDARKKGVKVISEQELLKDLGE